MTNLALIKKISKKSRIWAEGYAQSDYNVFSSKLDCMCAIASSYLSSQLTNNGIKNHIAIYEDIGFAHCFVVTSQYLIDITATQFNYKNLPNPAKDIEIINMLEDNIQKDYWEISKLFKSPNQLLRYQIQNDWPIEQRIDRDKNLLDLCIPQLPLKTFNIK